ncbi:MAG: ATP-binding protein [Polyangia bacterium]
MDYRTYPILYVDDELTNLQGMRYLLDERFELLTTADPQEALKLLAEQDIAVLLTDQRMPGMTGVELCGRARELRPDTVRILITAYSDLHAAIDAVNLGQVRRYLSKPHSEEELIDALRMAIDFFHLQRSVRDMEVRVLRSGTQATAQAVRSDLADELGVLQRALSLSLQQTRDLLIVGGSQGGSTRAAEVLREARRSTEVAAAVSEKVAALVDRLRKGFPVKTSASVKCDVARAVDAMVRIMRDEIERHGTLEVQIRAAPTAAMDASAVGNVLMQLLMNAAQARGAGPREKHHIIVAVEARDGEALVSIADNGIGIGPRVRERMFDSRFSTKEGNPGLGLAVVRELVSGVNGRIEVFSEVGMGTTVTIKIPLALT